MTFEKFRLSQITYLLCVYIPSVCKKFIFANSQQMDQKTRKKYSDLLLWLTPQEDVFLELIPFLSIQEALSIAFAQKQWLKYPITTSQQLNPFWQLLLKYQWRNVIGNNLVQRLLKTFRWS